MAGEHLETMTWPEAEQALARYRVVMVPLGARLKEHGLHLPLNNDWLMAEYLTRRVVERTEVLVAPTVQYSYYPALLDYPGSIHIGRQTSTGLVTDICRSLARFGGPRFYVLNTGISTNWALEPARQHLAEEGLVMEFTDLYTAVKDVEDAISEQECGSHADEIETSMMMYLAPHVVRPGLARKDCGEKRGPGPLTRDPDATTGIYSPTGAWGDPTLATREKGERVIEALVDHLVAAVEALAAEDFVPPPPRARYLEPRDSG